MSAVQIQTLWVTPQAAFVCTLQCLYQPQRVPQLTITGVPEAISKLLKQKLDVILFEFVGKPEGRIHLHFESFKDSALPQEVELACLIVILAAQNHINPKNILVFGSVQLDGRILLSAPTQRMILSELRKNNFRFREKIVISPMNLELGRELPLTMISKALLHEQILGVLNLGSSHAASTSKPQGEFIGESWYSELSSFLKKAATLILTGWHSSLLMGAPGTGKSHFAQGLGQMLSDLRGLTHPGSQPPLVIQPNSQCSPEHLVFGYRTKNVSGCWDEAKYGLLWLDEVTEFRRQSLEALRVPLDAYEDMGSRILIMTSNPCPCGFWNHGHIPCRCQGKERHHYTRKLSGPFIDRISIGFSPGKEFHSEIPVKTSYVDQLELIAKAQACIEMHSGKKLLSTQWADTGSISNLF